jgi:hypothetical protein
VVGRKWRLPPFIHKSETKQGDAFFSCIAQNHERSQNIGTDCKTPLAGNFGRSETKNAAQAGPLSGDISLGKRAIASGEDVYHRPNPLAKPGCAR